VKYLLDTNLWVSLLLRAPGHADVARLLDTYPNQLLATTDFAVHSLGILLARTRPWAYLSLLDELVTHPIGVLHLSPASLRRIPELMQAYDLDFDDAFQYTAAEMYDLRIVSFDSDFDRTPRGRVTPEQVLATPRETGS